MPFFTTLLTFTLKMPVLREFFILTKTLKKPMGDLVQFPYDSIDMT
jgi:hypothetical protein